MGKMRKMFLASGSPRRLELLQNLGLRIAQIKVPFDEPKALNFKEPLDFLHTCLDSKFEQAKAHLAEQKEIHKDVLNPLLICLIADTIVFGAGKILGKPTDNKEAFEMLKKLSNQKHQVFTGYNLWITCGKLQKTSKKWRNIVTTEVEFKKMPDAWLKSYIRGGEPMDKAGSYGVQGMGLQMIKSINGSYSSVMGLPLGELLVDLDAANKWIDKQ